MYGYKVMRYDDGKVISGANSRLVFDLEKGKIMKMSGNGIYVTPHKDYAIDYYSGLADNEVIIKFKFDEKDIITGNLEDKEPELSVSKVQVVDFEVLEESHNNVGNRFNCIFESIVNDFNIDKDELENLNDCTLSLALKAIDNSKLSGDPQFIEAVIKPIEVHVMEAIAVTSHLEDVARYMIDQVGYYDVRLCEELESIFDMYDKVYTCIATEAEPEEIYKVIKDELPDLEDWEHDFENGKLTYTRADDQLSGLRLEVSDIIDLMIFGRDTVCSVYSYDQQGQKCIHEEVIFHGKYIGGIIENIPSEYKK
jgi:hypothetical protein